MASATKDAWFSKSDEEKTAILDLMYKEYKPPTPTGRSTGSKPTPIRLPSEEDIKKNIEILARNKARLDDRLERVKYYNKYRTSLSNAEIFGMYEEDQRQKSQIFLEKYRKDKMKQKKTGGYKKHKKDKKGNTKKIKSIIKKHTRRH
jgi:hypothetical protein